MFSGASTYIPVISITACAVILALFAARILLKKAPKAALYALCAVVAIAAVSALLLMDRSSAQLPETGQSALVPGTAYVSSRCVYMNVLSSYSTTGDSGFRYYVAEDSFVSVYRETGAQNMIAVPEWRWQSFPYTDEEWAALYKLGSFSEMEHISELFDEILFQPLVAGKFILMLDGELWLVELGGDCGIWSIYSLVPEDSMGSAQWEHTPAVSARIPGFRFELGIDCTEFTAVCCQGRLTDFDAQEQTYSACITLSGEGAFYWFPYDENGNIMSSAAIYFSVYCDDNTFYNGTLYIDSSSGHSGRVYTATVVGEGLHLDQNHEAEGGLISASQNR